jgi:hypothetical protein
MSEGNSPADIFKNTVDKKFPLSNNIGSARFWTPMKPTTVQKGSDPDSCKEKDVSFALGIPRPNVNLIGLRFFSAFGGLLGLDHFYANSPATGLAKMLTLGGIGLWWVWDNLQLWLESDKVLNYGMMPLFDSNLFHEPVAQGMIVDGATGYESTQFSLWAFSELFLSLLGVNQIFLGKFGLFLFHLVFLVVIPLAIFLPIYFASGWTTSLIVLVAVYGSVFWLGHIFMWLERIIRIVSRPDKLFAGGGDDNGIPMASSISKYVNLFASMTGFETAETSRYTGQTGDEMRKLFRIRAREHETSDPECDEGGSPLNVFLDTATSPFRGILDFIARPFRKCPPPLVIEKETGNAMVGGGSPLSTESLVLGGTLIALMLGGGIKAAVNTFVAAP